MSAELINFPGAKISEPSTGAAKVEWRSREDVRNDILEHATARIAYGKAAAWEAQAEFQNLPPAQIEEARLRTAKALEEMTWRGTNLLIVMPTDPKALIDLLMYLEQNFTILPQEIMGRSLAFNLLRTMRLSLRTIAKYGKYQGSRD